MRQPSISWFVVVVLATFAVLVLLLFPPERYGFYPRCPVYTAFGVLCPGCGGTRAVAALLRGHIEDAIRLNALVTIAALLAIPGAALAAAARARLPKKMAHWCGSGWQQSVASVGLLAAVLFTLWRNLH